MHAQAVDEMERKLDLVKKLIARDETCTSIHDYLQRNRLTDLFPRCMPVLAKFESKLIDSAHGDSNPAKSGQTLQDHFSSLAQLHQMVAIALQLRQDLGSPYHDAVPYQMALLHHILGKAGPLFTDYRLELATLFSLVKKELKRYVPRSNITASSNVLPALSRLNTRMEDPQSISSSTHAQLYEWVTGLVTDVVFYRRSWMHIQSVEEQVEVVEHQTPLVDFVKAVSS
jgi:hypothetical protein